MLDDDPYFTAWGSGPTAQSNRKGIEAIISEALDWERRRSGATFEADKTAVVHFTRKIYKSDSEPFTIKGQTVHPKDYAKALRVVMDSKLKYKEYIARAAPKVLEAALELNDLEVYPRRRHDSFSPPPWPRYSTTPLTSGGIRLGIGL